MIMYTNMPDAVFSFFRLQNKRCLKLLGRIIASACLIFAVLIGVAALVGKILTDSSVIEKVQVAVVIPEDASTVRLAARYASTIESVDAICNFNYYRDEDKAMDDLKEGKMQVCVFFSDDFYDQVNSQYGIIQKVYVSDKNSLSFALFKNVLEDGIALLQTSAAGIYSACDTAKEYDAPVSAQEIDNLLMDIYLDKLFGRGHIFETELVSPIGTLSVERYIFFCLFVIAMLLPGLYFGGLYKPQSQSLEQKLRIYGVTAGWMCAIKTVIFAELVWLVSVLTYISGCIITEYFYLNLVYWDWAVLLKLIPISLVIGFIYNFIYSTCKNIRLAVVVILLLMVWVVTGSGIVVPVDYLPEALQGIQRFLHTGSVNKMLLEMIYGNVSNMV